MIRLLFTLGLALALATASQPIDGVDEHDPRLELVESFKDLTVQKQFGLLKSKLTGEFEDLVQDVYAGLTSYVFTQNPLLDVILSLEDQLGLLFMEGGFDLDIRPVLSLPTYCILPMDHGTETRSSNKPGRQDRRANRIKGLDRMAGYFKRMYNTVKEIRDQVLDVVHSLESCKANMTTIRHDIHQISEIVGSDAATLGKLHPRPCVGLYSMKSLKKHLTCKTSFQCIAILSENTQALHQKTRIYQMETMYLQKNCDLAARFTAALRDLLRQLASTKPELVEKYFTSEELTA